jgi:hypothetical protein
LALVDVTAKVVPNDCTPDLGGAAPRGDQPTSLDAFVDCSKAQGEYDSANNPDLPTVTLDAYRRLGQGFVAAGGGVLFAVSGSVGAQLNLNVMYMLPDSGLVLEPSLGGVYAF